MPPQRRAHAPRRERSEREADVTSRYHPREAQGAPRRERSEREAVRELVALHDAELAPPAANEVSVRRLAQRHPQPLRDRAPPAANEVSVRRMIAAMRSSNCVRRPPPRTK